MQEQVICPHCRKEQLHSVSLFCEMVEKENTYIETQCDYCLKKFKAVLRIEVRHLFTSKKIEEVTSERQ